LIITSWCLTSNDYATKAQVPPGPISFAMAANRWMIENGEVTHYLTIVTIGSHMARLGFHADLCSKFGIRHRHVYTSMWAYPCHNCRSDMLNLSVPVSRFNRVHIVF
jgi:hypothetical protein